MIIKRKPLSGQTKRKISDAQKGNKNHMFGKAPWNKGKKLSVEHRNNLSISHKGKKHTDEWKEKMSNIAKQKKFGKWMKGRVSLNKNKKYSQISNEKNCNWKGDEVSYSGLHYWVYSHLGKPTICKFCGRTKNIQWANKSGEYRRDITDWLNLCVYCHRKYDKNITIKKYNKFLKKL